MNFVQKHAAALVVGLTLFAVLVVIVSNVEAHRPYNGNAAQRSVNNFVRYHYCGGNGWTCKSVFAPVVRCGYHHYCWSGVSHREGLCGWGVCIKHRNRISAGKFNAHTGKIWGYGER